MNSKKSAWEPSRAALKRRIERRLESPAATKPGRSAGGSVPADQLHPVVGAVRSLSTRIDRLAVEQLRGMSRVETELEEIRKDLEAIRSAPTLRSAAVEVCLIDEMLIGFPSEEWRLVAYCQQRGAPEPGTLRRFRSLAEPGMYVADVGANVGLFTIAAAVEVGTQGSVVAFEPTPRTHSILMGNVQLNGLLESGRVMVHQVAIADRAGLTQFGLHYSNCGHNSFYSLQELTR